MIENVGQTAKSINATVIVSSTHDCVILAIQVPQKWTLKDWVVTSMDKRRKGSMTTGEGAAHKLTFKDPDPVFLIKLGHAINWISNQVSAIGTDFRAYCLWNQSFVFYIFCVRFIEFDLYDFQLA